MRFTMHHILAASSLLLAVGAVASESFEVLVPRDMTLVGCYNSADGLTNQTSYTFQSSGWCFQRCKGTNAATFALTGGSDCLCGSELPPSSAKVSSDKCDRKCDGWPDDKCGGVGFYSVYTTGLDPDVSTVSASTTKEPDTTTASKTDQAATSVSTNSGGETVVVTAVSEHTPISSVNTEAENTKNSHNTAAIAAGVVIGVVGVAALAGAAFFFYRSRKQKTQGFGGAAGGYGRDSQPPSMSDSRFDGEYMAQRRQSNGSIDDDHDFSRRILQVTNPDRHY
ncbi:uncharacterized protein N7459_009945 [Penicillium hispanicum]|uniref:uncharacterized protein n=1 Tax=Penicillium hispanicum TaxID=1080232 RepID=UPI002542212F|nr:uncharacterized protein N7459_009945 [Penicillium hispanicum]KAJ5570515.1 hypothetical protein N7459_009945 [Penicillium hispanicum]